MSTRWCSTGSVRATMWIQCFAYDTLDALPYHRVVFFARHEHQARVEPSERVAAH
jgi:hypothetical protein